MAITHTQTIPLLEVLIGNSDNVVENIKLVTTSVDDSNPSKYKVETQDRFHITTDGITSSTAGFVAYESLTEATVLGWISSELAASNTKEVNESKINLMISRDNPIAEDKAVPW
tara:strand:+ start:415 stop:756 length:342 start_codon:yes stop_codon:yes gene_type:complete